MSALVARAINDSLGTSDFKGLNSIIQETLDNFTNDFSNKVGDTIRGAISNGVVASENELFVIDIGNNTVLGSSYAYIGEPITFRCKGSYVKLAVGYYNSDLVSVVWEKNGKSVYDRLGGIPNFLKVSYGDTIRVKVKATGATTEYCPKLSICADVVDLSCLDVG